MTTPYTLPEPVIIDRHIPTNLVIRGYKADQMHAAFAAGAASRDAAFAELEQDYSAKCNELELVHAAHEAQVAAQSMQLAHDAVTIECLNDAIAAEREACACIAESINDGCTGAPDGPEEIAAAIRLRSNA